MRNLQLTEYGGTTRDGKDRREGRRKIQRPFASRKPIQLTLEASCATGKLSMLSMKRQLVIRDLINVELKRADAKLHSYANAGNRLRLQATFPSRAAFQKFLRTVTALIARLVTGARKGKPFGKFWNALAHSKLLGSATGNGERGTGNGKLSVLLSPQTQEHKPHPKRSFLSSDP